MSTRKRHKGPAISAKHVLDFIKSRKRLLLDAPVIEIEGHAEIPIEGHTDILIGQTGLPLESHADIPIEGHTNIPIEGNADIPIEGNTELPIEGDTDIPIEGHTGIHMEGHTGHRDVHGVLEELNQDAFQIVNKYESVRRASGGVAEDMGGAEVVAEELIETVDMADDVNMADDAVAAEEVDVTENYVIVAKDVNLVITEDGAANTDDSVPAVTHGVDDSPAGESDATCAICLSSVSLCSVHTSCDHVYCCACLMTYWRHQTQLGRMKCPTCRATVTSLSVVFRSEEAEHENPHADHVQSLDVYNRRFSSAPKPLGQHVFNLLLWMAFCLREFFSVTGLIWMFWARLVIVFFSLCIGFMSLLDVGPGLTDQLGEMMETLDRMYLSLLLMVYCSIVVRRSFPGMQEGNVI